MAALTTQNIVRTGLAPTFGAVAASDTFTPDAQTFLYVTNGGGSSDTVTITVAGGDPNATLLIADTVVAVANGTSKVIGPFPATYYADPTTGVATVAHSFTTSVTCAVFKLGQP